MPLFFLAGGAAGAYSWRAGTPWGAWLFKRAQRLCRPVFWYLAVWTVVLIAVQLTMGAESAEALGRECVALSGGSAVFDGIRFAVGSAAAGTPNLVVVWLIPMVIGVAYARRLIQPRPALAVALAAFAAQVLLVVVGPYDVSLVVTGTERVSNVSPPTVVLALHCTWMSCVFVAAARAFQRWAEHPRVWRVVAVGNGGAMTLYLWHIPAIAIAAFTMHAVGLDAFDPHAPGFWGRLALRAVVFAVVMAGAFKLLSPLEHRPLPWWDAPVTARRGRLVLAGALICVAGAALTLMAKNGLDGVTGWSALGGFAIAAIAARRSAGTANGT